MEHDEMGNNMENTLYSTNDQNGKSEAIKASTSLYHLCSVSAHILSGGTMCWVSTVWEALFTHHRYQRIHIFARALQKTTTIFGAFWLSVAAIPQSHHFHWSLALLSVSHSFYVLCLLPVQQVGLHKIPAPLMFPFQRDSTSLIFPRNKSNSERILIELHHK